MFPSFYMIYTINDKQMQYSTRSGDLINDTSLDEYNVYIYTEN